MLISKKIHKDRVKIKKKWQPKSTGQLENSRPLMQDFLRKLEQDGYFEKVFGFQENGNEVFCEGHFV